MKLTWLGTAGFEIKTANQTIYLDPYLSRNTDAVPVQTKTIADIKPESPIFVSHAHFDHLMDLPDIMKASSSPVYCSDTAKDYLIRSNIPGSRVHMVEKNHQQFHFDGFSAQAIFSRHVVFDFRLVISTLAAVNVKFFSCLPYLYRYPCGQVLCWRFNLEGKSLVFYGSAGASDRELVQTAKEGVNVLLLPLQGHSDICRIGLNFVNILKPQLVIPHHHDNFFPPISRTVDITPFINQVKDTCPKTEIIVPQMNQAIAI